MFEMEVLKEEFAFRTQVAIALANYALAKENSVHTISVRADYFCKELRDIVRRLPPLHIPQASEDDPLPVSRALLAYAAGSLDSSVDYSNTADGEEAGLETQTPEVDERGMYWDPKE